MEAMAAAGAVVAWLGATILTVSDARGGAALGLVVAGTGLAVASAAVGRSPMAAAAVAAAGACAGAARLRGGEPGWGLLPPGSTPRLIGSVVTLIVAGLVAGSGSGTPSAAARLGGLLVCALAAGRMLTTRWRWSSLAAGSALALGLGSLGEAPALLAGAAVAAGLGVIDGAERAQAEE